MREQAHAFAQEEATRAAQEKAAADKAAAAAAAAAAASSEAQLVAKAEDEAAADFFKDGVIDAAATPQAPQETLQVPQEEEVLCSRALLPTLRCWSTWQHALLPDSAPPSRTKLDALVLN
ncbi:MAG: hypothetical protein ACPIOQ_84435 [Promethearchaeia archaeon]